MFVFRKRSTFLLCVCILNELIFLLTDLLTYYWFFLDLNLAAIKAPP